MNLREQPPGTPEEPSIFGQRPEIERESEASPAVGKIIAMKGLID